MSAARRYLARRLLAAALFGLVGAGTSHGQSAEELAPYKMLRSLQFVQDSVVGGDHAAGEMQKFMLASLDKRLRTADPSIYEDPRNVDAALIYAMSGGNPATLDFLVSKDVEGYFDNRVSDALRKYLHGKGALVAKPLAEMMPEYRDSKIGPYLALVSASASLPENPKTALGFYDYARLVAPGTNIEEAALRRSLAIAVGSGMVHEGLAYSSHYARRFLHSPYAGQFVDMFVMLAVDNYGQVRDEDIEDTLGVMDADRRREAYVRIARKAVIAGKMTLANLATTRAEEIPLSQGLKSIGQVDLYSGLANLASPEVGRIVDDLVGMNEDAMSKRDQALRAAAKFVGEEVLRKPDANAIMLPEPEIAPMAPAETASQPVAVNGPGAEHKETDAEASAATEVADAKPAQAKVTEAKVADDSSFNDFVSKGRSRLGEIDNLLQEGK